MAKNPLICSLDIGTSNTRAIVGEIDRDGNVNIIGIGQCQSTGLKKGIIIDIDATVRGIADAISQAERMIGEAITSVFVAIGGPQTNLLKNRGVVAVHGDDREVTEADVDRVIQAARVLAIPPEREIINVSPISYIVDGYEGIKDPVGMIGVRLEVDALIVTGQATYLQNIRRCVERAGLEVSGLIFKGLSSGFMALSRDERELGCALVDIGGGVSEIAIYKHDNLISFASIPQGGDLITQDLAHGLRVSMAQAEQIKQVYGAATFESAGSDVIRVESVGSAAPYEVESVQLVDYIQPRVEEIFDYIRNELIRAGFNEPPGGGVVLTGGTCQLPGLPDVAARKLGTNVRIFRPKQIGVTDPSFTASTAVLQFIARHDPLILLKPQTRRKSSAWGDKIKALMRDLFG
ncbi:MAG: cell division protein FtsA [Firmicutes bacterium]|nr:cell division protein FtsA [Bacillota bacterium]HOB34427.1 cell division protein FtsA [Bacillota bacterium]HPZ89833.1 cell division protein FtsA [Bacillota bacterium]HQE01151.1 cell division protein FtsA [Bacillota bacterium]